MVGSRAAQGLAKELDRSGDRLCFEELAGTDTLPNRRLPRHRQQHRRTHAEAHRHRPQKLYPSDEGTARRGAPAGGSDVVALRDRRGLRCGSRKRSTTRTAEYVTKCWLMAAAASGRATSREVARASAWVVCQAL